MNENHLKHLQETENVGVVPVQFFTTSTVAMPPGTPNRARQLEVREVPVQGEQDEAFPPSLREDERARLQLLRDLALEMRLESGELRRAEEILRRRIFEREGVAEDGPG